MHTRRATQGALPASGETAGNLDASTIQDALVHCSVSVHSAPKQTIGARTTHPTRIAADIPWSSARAQCGQGRVIGSLENTTVP